MSSSSIAKELWEAYRRTEYWLATSSRLCLHVDQSAVGLPDFPWAYITAWNPRSGIQPQAVNRRRQSELEARLKSMGIFCIAGVAKDPHGNFPDEEGVLALGIKKEPALALAREFGQNAILAGFGEGKVALIAC